MKGRPGPIAGSGADAADERGAAQRGWDWGNRHLERLSDGLASLTAQLPDLARAGAFVADSLQRGGRLLALGNGGSAAQAEHLTAELVGRFQGERRPLSAISLTSDTASLTALANDYGAAALFARQVEAHGRAGDVLVALSTSGRSPNALAAVETAQRLGLTVIALTGPIPNFLAARADRSFPVAADETATVQEVHQVMVHLLCAAIDERLAASDGAGRRRPALGMAR